VTELPAVPARQIPVTGTFHGVAATDHYRWLRFDQVGFGDRPLGAA